MGERDRGVPYGGNEETFWITQARGNPGGKEITMDEIKLKPCPFCGGEAEINVDREAVEDTEKRHWAYTVVCKRCCATSGLTYLPEKAREAWNRRADNG